MLDKIKRFIKKLKKKHAYNTCYYFEELIGNAVFGMCSGTKEETNAGMCTECAFYRNIKESED